jgi:preprotein translocase subunit SecA
LAIIGTESHESRRVDRQLRGRAGRQGDPGSSQFYVSFEDDLMRMFGSERIASLMDKLGYKEGDVIQHSMISNSIQRAQKKVEENNFGIRKRLLEYDDVMNHAAECGVQKKKSRCVGERLALDIDTSYFNMAEGIVNSYKEQDDYEGFKMACIVNFGVDSNINSEVFQKTDSNSLTDKLYEEISAKYSVHKEEVKKQAIPVFKNIRLTQGSHIENVVVPFTDGKKSMNVLANLDKTIKTDGGELASALEKTITLVVIDDAWKNHLRAMDDLKQSVQTAYLEQKDPLVIYKVEAYKLFEGMNGEVNRDIVSFLSHATLPIQDENANLKEGRQQKTDMSKMQANKEEVDAAGEDYAANEKDKPVPITVGPKIGRNDPCPCGSGKKYKNCHGVEA